MTQEVWNKIINSEMLLIGIGTQLSVKEDNEKQIDEVYDTLAKLAKGRNCFVITSNTDQKLLDGRISKFLTAAPKVEGQEKQWEAYMNWLSCSLTHELTILELGEGFADPMVMRWPFDADSCTSDAVSGAGRFKWQRNWCEGKLHPICKRNSRTVVT